MPFIFLGNTYSLWEPNPIYFMYISEMKTKKLDCCLFLAFFFEGYFWFGSGFDGKILIGICSFRKFVVVGQHGIGNSDR